MRPLYDIGSDLEQLRTAMESAPDGEIPAELEAWFAGLEQEEGQKLDSYVGLIKQLIYEGKACEDEYKLWHAKALARGRAIDALEDRLKLHLERTKRKSITTPGLTKISLCKNGGKRPVTIFADVPDESPYFKDYFVAETVISPNREKIRQALEAGVELPFAKLEEPGQHLRIK